MRRIDPVGDLSDDDWPGAVCQQPRTTLPERRAWFAPRHTTQHELAKQLCTTCPYQLGKCLQRAQAVNPTDGVWAGVPADVLRKTDYSVSAVQAAIAADRERMRKLKPWNRKLREWDGLDDVRSDPTETTEEAHAC